jgi:hypothetical protein
VHDFAWGGGVLASQLAAHFLVEIGQDYFKRVLY